MTTLLQVAHTSPVTAAQKLFCGDQQFPIAALLQQHMSVVAQCGMKKLFCPLLKQNCLLFKHFAQLGSSLARL